MLLDPDSASVLSLMEWIQLTEVVEAFNLPASKTKRMDFVPIILSNVTMLFSKQDFQRVLDSWETNWERDIEKGGLGPTPLI